MTEDLRARAAVFAALGEPVRLAIVDRLVVEDLSPGDLAADLGLGSNLLAHHLRVLEDARVIRRTRSEGDRRRSYLQLRLDSDATRVASAKSSGPSRLPATLTRVVFVCTANSARSQLAAATWNSISPIPAASAGTHPAGRVHPRAVDVARRHGLTLDGVRPAHLEDVLRGNELVVAVCDNAHEELGPTVRRLHWSVADPATRGSAAAFELAYAELHERVHHLAALRAGR